ncbi:MAG: hypothetical protein NC416_12955 [Eubacterium sp.]|nr:hypothetical protein [Eubacterium sp.]
MKRNRSKKTTLAALLALSCAGMLLSGCAADEKGADEPAVGQEISPEDLEATKESSSDTLLTDASTANDSAETTTTDTSTLITPDVENTTPADSPDTSQPSPVSGSLYEQFLNNSIPATISSDYPQEDYVTPIFERGSSFTLTELGERVSQYFLNPEYTDKTSYDSIQYAYVGCPDSADADARNLLVKFIGLNIYSQDDDSYAVFIITENDGQLYVTDSYECWARSSTIAYADGSLHDSGSGGAGDHYASLLAILSNGKKATVYASETLEGWWTSSVNDTIYNEVYGENTECSLIVTIYTIGGNNYYQYDLSMCPDEEKPFCENYISRCRDEAGINWVTWEEIQSAIQNNCSALGLDYGILDSQEEAVWNNL